MRPSESAPLLAALALAVACGPARPDLAPRPERVEPATAEQGRATDVLILGAGFEPAVELRVGGAARGDAAFRATLGGVALEQVRWIDHGTLSGRVPAGLAPGAHALVVEGPHGRSAELAAAFQVLAGEQEPPGEEEPPGGPEAELLATDPFGDGTSSAQLAVLAGRVYVGPDARGERVARLEPQGGAAELLQLALQPLPAADGADGDGDSGANPMEQGATFFGGTLGGEELLWLAPAGGSTEAAYVWAARSATDRLDPSWLELDLDVLEDSPRRVLATRFVGGRLYLGYDSAGQGPRLVAVGAPPAEGGTPDAAALDLNAAAMPAVGLPAWCGSTPPSRLAIEAIGDLGGRLYLGGTGGWARSTSAAAPRRSPSAVCGPGPTVTWAPGAQDWADATPSAPAWAGRTSIRLPAGAGDPAPGQRAVPAFAAFGGRLHALRNVIDGPSVAVQLWACDPAGGADPAGCEPGDWALVAPDPARPALTWLGGSSCRAGSVLAATARWLYVGLDCEGGVELFRAAAPPAAAADFRGAGGCVAGSDGCSGVGGAGFGAPDGVKQLLDAEVVAEGGADALYVVAGAAGRPLRVYRIAD